MRTIIGLAVIAGLTASQANAHQPQASKDWRTGTKTLVESLNAKQKKAAVGPFDSSDRLDWHYVPTSREGLPIKEMTPEQKDYLEKTLKTFLSEKGFVAAQTIMDLERILNKEEFGWISRDPELYYLEVFGTPSPTATWGFSFEGHHLSLNYVIESDKIKSFSPMFFGANPAIVKKDYGVGPKKGTRPLAEQETLAFDLMASFNAKQKKQAVVSNEAPSDLRGGGDHKAPPFEKVGIPKSQLTKEQSALLEQIIASYMDLLPDSMGEEAEKHENIYFAWWGTAKPGKGHYYRIDSPMYVIELANTQADVSGNDANHVHTLWRSRD